MSVLTSSSKALTRNIFLPCALALLACLASSVPLQAQQRASGEWLTIPGTINSDVCNDLKSTIDRAMNRGVRKIVLEFQFKELSDFGPCYDLANYLLEKIHGRTQIIAFASQPIYGYSLLPFFACKTIYITPEVSLGFDRNAAERAQPDDPKISAFMKVATMRGRSPALLLKMLKPDFRVMEFLNEGRKFRIPADQLKDIALSAENKNLVALQDGDARFQPKVFRDAGTLGLFNSSECELFGLADLVTKNVQAASEKLGVKAGSAPLSANPRAARIVMEGELTNGILEMVQEKIRRAVNEKFDCIILELNNASGGPDVVARASTFAADLHTNTREEHKIKTIAFLNENCAGAANYLALACDEIILGPEAKLGDVSSLVYKEQNLLFSEADIKVRKESLMTIAERSNHPKVLVRGFFESDIELIRVMDKIDPDKDTDPTVMIIDAKEISKNQTQVGEPLKKKGKILILDSKPAVEIGLARSVLLSKDIQGVYSIFGINSNNVVTMAASWLDNVVFFLQLPAVTVALFIIGIMGVILEMKAPGTTIPIVIAAICFMLLFWSQTSGEVSVLAILLFLLGFVFIGVEIFLLPGFGLIGVAGIVLVILSVSLLLVKHWPTSTGEYIQLGKHFVTFSGAMIFAIAGAFYLFRNIGSLPWFNRIVLQAPSDDTDGGASLPPALTPELLGAIGTAVTSLRPAGKAAFGEQYIDVSAESGFIDAGKRVQVIEIDGLRVIVKSV